MDRRIGRKQEYKQPRSGAWMLREGGGERGGRGGVAALWLPSVYACRGVQTAHTAAVRPQHHYKYAVAQQPFRVHDYISPAWSVEKRPFNDGLRDNVKV